MDVRHVLVLANFILIIFYILHNKRESKYYWKTRFDDFIPFISVFVIPYLLLFPFYLLVIYLLWETQYIQLLLASLAAGSLLGSIFWFCFPNGTKRYLRTENEVFSRIANFIYKHDSDTNAFPSSHVYLSLICSYYAMLQFGDLRFAIAIMGILISLSTVFTKQHYIKDIFGGIGVTIIAIGIAHYFIS